MYKYYYYILQFNVRHLIKTRDCQQITCASTKFLEVDYNEKCYVVTIQTRMGFLELLLVEYRFSRP